MWLLLPFFLLFWFCHLNFAWNKGVLQAWGGGENKHQQMVCRVSVHQIKCGACGLQRQLRLISVRGCLFLDFSRGLFMPRSAHSGLQIRMVKMLLKTSSKHPICKYKNYSTLKAITQGTPSAWFLHCIQINCIPTAKHRPSVSQGQYCLLIPAEDFQGTSQSFFHFIC